MLWWKTKRLMLPAGRDPRQGADAHVLARELQGQRGQAAVGEQVEAAQAGVDALRQDAAVLGALLGRVVVAADAHDRDAVGAQPRHLARHVLALGVAWVWRIEEIARLEEQMGAAVERELHGGLEPLAQPAASLGQPRGRQPVVVAIQMVVAGDDQLEAGFHHLPRASKSPAAETTLNARENEQLF
jgi:hypothetical protein